MILPSKADSFLDEVLDQFVSEKVKSSGAQTLCYIEFCTSCC